MCNVKNLHSMTLHGINKKEKNILSVDYPSKYLLFSISLRNHKKRENTHIIDAEFSLTC